MWGILILLAVVGIVLLLVSHNFIPAGGFQTLITELGIVALTSAILGFTIDRWMKKEIARDVFKAAVGYILPEEFREEIRRNVSYKFMATQHIMTIDIEKIDAEHVRVTTTIERTLQNITTVAEPLGNYHHIDEWGFAVEQSQIAVCEIAEADGSNSTSGASLTRNEHEVMTRAAERQVGPGQSVKLYSKSSEIHRHNGHAVFVFLSPTKNPEISINLPDGFDYSCGFGRSGDKIEVARFAKKHTLKGTYFPPSHMRVRWWPRPATAPAASS